MESYVEVLITGGGFAGLATAYHLTQQAGIRVTVLEQEHKLGGHASGRNAGMIRQALSDPSLVCLAKEGRKALRRASSSGWRHLDFRPRGSLLLARGRETRELENIHRALTKAGISSEWLSRSRAIRRVEPLREADFEKALFCPSDAMVEIDGLLADFVTALKRRGVRILCSRELKSLARTKRGFVVKTSHGIFHAKKVVNAAGAWAGVIGRKAGAVRIPFKAYRRHLFFADAVPGFSPRWPFVWDLSHQVYFRPQRRRLMLSPCDKVLFSLDGRKKRYGTDPRMERALLKKLDRFSSCFKGIRIRSRTAGLRTMVPDGRFVIGEDPKLKNFYWVAGLGGHGVTTAFSVGRMAGNLILGKKVDEKLKKAFSPDRFYASKS